MTKLYRVARRNEEGEWVPVHSWKAGPRETIYATHQTATNAMIGFKGQRYHPGGPYRVEQANVDWMAVSG